MDTSVRYDAFLSYARDDDEPFVARLYHDLTNPPHAFRIWWDREQMPNRGRTFSQEIRDRIDESARLIGILGPQALTSAYVRSEWDHALLFARATVIVPRMSGYDQIPPAFAGYHGPDFRDDSRYSATLLELARILSEPVQPRALLTGVPSLPTSFLSRSADLDSIGALLLADVEKLVPLAPSARIASLVGMPGTGKSVLAAAFARSIRSRMSFSDGVVWVSVGQEPAPLQVAQMIGVAFGQDPGPERPLAYARLARLLENSKCLIVLDNVWNTGDIQDAINVMGDFCRVLITTRDAGVATAFTKQVHDVEVLTDEAAERLLADHSGSDPWSLPRVARKVARECGNLPFALALCGKMAADGTPWQDLLEWLTGADLASVEWDLPNYQYRDLLKAQHVSVAALQASDAERYHDLAVFPAAVPEQAVLTLWSTGGLTEPQARKVLSLLHRRSLIRMEGAPPSRRVSLHDLQHDYLRATAGDLRARYSRLLDAYERKCGGVWARGPNDGYFFQSLPANLMAAGRANECEGLLIDFAWLEAKLRATRIAAVLDDFRLLARGSIAWMVEEALHRSAITLSDDPSQLAGQLLGRLLAIHPPELDALLDQARRWTSGPWLRPILASLEPPGSILHGTLEGHEGSPRSVAISEDGRWAASAGNSHGDGTVRLWDAEYGTALHVLPGQAEEGQWTPLAFTTSGELLLSALRTRIYAWNVASGRLAFPLDGHADTITGIAVAAEDFAASVSKDGIVMRWDLAARVGRQVAAHREPLFGVAVSRDGNCIVAASATALLYWALDTGHHSRLDVDTGFSGSFRDPRMAIEPDGKCVFFGSPLKEWWPDTDAVRTVFEDEHDQVEVAALTACGPVALVTFRQFVPGLWQRHDRESYYTPLPDQRAYIYCAALTPDGSRAVIGLGDHRLRVLNVGAISPAVEKYERPRASIAGLVTSTDNRHALAQYGDGSAAAWDLESGATVIEPYEAFAFDQGVPAYVENLEKGWKLLAVNQDHAILTEVQRAKTGEYEEPDETDGTHGWRVYVYEQGSEDTLLLGFHHLPVYAGAIDAAGTRCVTGGVGRKLRVWDLRSRTQVRILTGHRDTVAALAAPRDQPSLCISASDDRTVRLWDVDQGRAIAIYTADYRLTHCAITPDASAIVAADAFGTIHTLRVEGVDRRR